MSTGEWVSKIVSLENGEISILGRIADASNATLLGEIDGKKIVYKPVAGERPLWDFPDGNLAHREFAAYLVSEFLEFKVVPLTILRDGPYGLGMVQEWIDSDEEIDIVELAQSANEEIRKIALFDILINNGDRKFGHFLPATPDAVFAIDHGVTFNVENKLRTVLWQWIGEPFTEFELKAIDRFISLFPSEQMRQLLTDMEIEAALARAKSLSLGGVFPEPSEDWPAIPWPPF